MGIMVYSLLWVMQDFVHQPWVFLNSGVWEPQSGRSGPPLPFSWPRAPRNGLGSFSRRVWDLGPFYRKV